jgi:hypothetical protein
LIQTRLSALIAAATLVLSGAATVQVAAAAPSAAPTAAPATAVAARSAFVRDGHPMGVVPHAGAKSAQRIQSVNGTNPSCPGCTPPLVFHTGMAVGGGLSIYPGHVTIVPVYWAPAGFQFTPNYKTVVNRYIADVAHDSNKSTNVFAPSTQYYQTVNSITTKIQYVVTAGTEMDLTDAFPGNYPGNASGCQPDFGYTRCVTDAALQTELNLRLASLGRPVDDAHIYMVMFPYNTTTGFAVQTCFDPGPSSIGGTSDPNQACSSDYYCAYHSAYQHGPNSNNQVLYANEPLPAHLSYCTGELGPQAPNGDTYADAVLSSFSHEANETITDWQGAWYDSSGNENGDECGYVYGLSGGSTGVAVPDGQASGTMYNQTINGHHYYTQDEFSNEDWARSKGDLVADGDIARVYGCVQKEELPVAAFTPPAVTVNVGTIFSASGSSDADGGIATYTWTWGDATPNTSGATQLKTFTVAGTFNVKLTVKDVDGWSRVVTHSVIVTGGPTMPSPPTAVVATPGSGQAGLTWTVPASNGGSAITNYRVTPYIGTTAGTSVLTGSTTPSFTITGLSHSVTYKFKVAAVNVIGTSAKSAYSNAITTT